MIYHGDALEYIQETPGVLRAILDNADQITEDCIKLLKGRKISELYLIGLGSSYHSAKAVHVFLQNLLGIRVYPVCPVDFMDMQKWIRDDALVMGISQQGTSTGVISAMDKVKQENIPVIAVTGEHDTEITRHGDAVLYIECGYEDAGATTKGFTATIFTLLLFGIQLWEEQSNRTDTQRKRSREYLGNLLIEMELNLRKNKNLSEEVAEILSKSTDLMIVSGEKWKYILSEIVLKFSETCRFPVRGFEAEEFMHGLYNAVKADTDFLFLWDEQSDGLEKLYQYYKEKGNTVICMGRGNVPKEQSWCVPQDDKAAFEENDCFSVFKDILLLQEIFVLTSRKRGINLNIPRDPDFHKIMGSKLEIENEEP